MNLLKKIKSEIKKGKDMYLYINREDREFLENYFELPNISDT